MENLSNMCICLHGSGARRPPYTHYSCEKMNRAVRLQATVHLSQRTRVHDLLMFVTDRRYSSFEYTKLTLNEYQN